MGRKWPPFLATERPCISSKNRFTNSNGLPAQRSKRLHGLWWCLLPKRERRKLSTAKESGSHTTVPLVGENVSAARANHDGQRPL